MEKHINIGGKDYILTANRKLLKTIYNIAPDFLDLDNKDKKGSKKISIDLIADIDILFFDMLKIAHSEIDKEESDKILEQFNNEYADGDNALINLAMSVFTEGNKGSAKKKKINW